MSRSNVRKGGRPRKGALLWRATKGWCARLTVTIDGERVRKVVELGTADKLAARRKLQRLLLETEGAPDAGEVVARTERPETFADAAERIYRLRVAAGVKSAKDEHGRTVAYAVPLLGELPVSQVTASQVNGVLDSVAERGKSKQTVIHVKQGLRAIFAQLKREGAIAGNPASEAALPRMPQVPRRERVILTDEELAIYLAYAPPDRRERYGVAERQTLAAVSRMFGGLRSGDLHALRWEHLDTADFIWGVAPREKTGTPQPLEIPVPLRPILRQWWEEHRSPETGLVFPASRGKRAGEHKIKVSHARALKKDLRRAFGLSTWDGERWQDRPVSTYDRRELELFTETSYSRPVDFHSFRRAFTTALADAGVTVQIAMRLAGHTSTAAHMRYVMAKVRQVPEAALPKLLPAGGFGTGRAETRGSRRERRGILGDSGGVDGTRTRGLRRDRRAADSSAGESAPSFRSVVVDATTPDEASGAQICAPCLNPAPKPLRQPETPVWTTSALLALGALARCIAHDPEPARSLVAFVSV